ncbi:MAG TPA: hypothetical protein DCM49_05865 [Lachnospiraceae bacterium]|nr:hypothetical protein [Lachnospiraceae bacterium]
MQSTEKISYWSISNTKPTGMVKRRKKRVIKPVHGLIYFVVVMLLSVTAGSAVQRAFGIAGVALTEILLLMTAAAFAWIRNVDLKRTFPVRTPKIMGLFGVLFLWIGAYAAAILVNLFLMLIDPVTFDQYSDAQNSLLSYGGKAVLFIIIAVLPAICEEAVHRGIILTSVKNGVSETWKTVCILGVYFALFHIYPVKYPTMFLLGAAATYICLITNNMVYSSFMHFLNNAFAVVLEFVAGVFVLNGPRAYDMVQKPALFSAGIFPGSMIGRMAAVQSELAISGMAVGVSVIFYGIPIPICLYLGDYLLKKAEAPVRPKFLPEGKEGRRIIELALASGVFFFGGLFIMIASVII